MPTPSNLAPTVTFMQGGGVALTLRPETLNSIMVSRARVLSPADSLGAIRFVPVDPATTTINMTSIDSSPYANTARVAGCTWSPTTNSVVANNEITLCERQKQYELCSDEFRDGFRVLLQNDGRGFANTPEATRYIQELLGRFSSQVLRSLLLTAKLGGFWTEAEIEAWVLRNDDLREGMLATLLGCDGWLTQMCDLAAGDPTNYSFLNRDDLITTVTDFNNGGRALKADVAVAALNSLYDEAPPMLAEMLSGGYIGNDGRQAIPMFVCNSGVRNALFAWAAQQEGTTNDFGMNVKIRTESIDGFPMEVAYFRGIRVLVDTDFDTVNGDNLSSRLYMCYLTVSENIQIAAGFDLQGSGESAMSFRIYGQMEDPERYGKIQGSGYYRLGAGVPNPQAMTGFAHVEPLT